MYSILRSFEDGESVAPLILPHLQEAVDYLKKEGANSEIIQEVLRKLGATTLTLHKLSPQTIVQLYSGYQQRLIEKLREQNDKLQQNYAALLKEKEGVERENERLKRKRERDKEEHQQQNHHQPVGGGIQKKQNSNSHVLNSNIQTHLRGVFMQYKYDNEHCNNALNALYRECDLLFNDQMPETSTTAINELRRTTKGNLCSILRTFGITDVFFKDAICDGIDQIFRNYIQQVRH
jgi:hypothetical protein